MKTLMAFIKAYNEFKKEHKEEIIRQRQLDMLAKAPFNYRMIESFIAAFVNKNQKDLVVEMKGADVTVTLKWDKDGYKQTASTTQQILNAYNGVN